MRQTLAVSPSQPSKVLPSKIAIGPASAVLREHRRRKRDLIMRRVGKLARVGENVKGTLFLNGIDETHLHAMDWRVNRTTAHV
jgi:hypothetical protein